MSFSMLLGVGTKAESSIRGREEKEIDIGLLEARYGQPHLLSGVMNSKTNS